MNDYIKSLKRYIGVKVYYNNVLHTIMDVDSNGMALIDLPAQFTATTAVPFTDLDFAWGKNAMEIMNIMNPPVKYHVVITDMVEGKQTEIGENTVAMVKTTLMMMQNRKEVDFDKLGVITNVYSVPFDFDGVMDIKADILALGNISKLGKKGGSN